MLPIMRSAESFTTWICEQTDGPVLDIDPSRLPTESMGVDACRRRFMETGPDEVEQVAFEQAAAVYVNQEIDTYIAAMRSSPACRFLKIPVAVPV